MFSERPQEPRIHEPVINPHSPLLRPHLPRYVLGAAPYPGDDSPTPTALMPAYPIAERAPTPHRELLALPAFEGPDALEIAAKIGITLSELFTEGSTVVEQWQLTEPDTKPLKWENLSQEQKERSRANWRNIIHRVLARSYPEDYNNGLQPQDT